MNFIDLEFYNGAFVLPPDALRIVFSGCKFNQFTAIADCVVFFLNCALGSTPPVFSYGGEIAFHGGITTAFLSPVSGTLLLEADFMFQGCHVEARGGAQLNIGQACSFDSPVHGLHVHDNCTVELIASAYGIPRLWGIADPAAYGIDVDSGGLMRILFSVTPTLTGGAGDFILSGATTARAWDEGAGAYIAPAACTWVNFNGALAPGGVRNAHNVALNAAIVDVGP